MHTLRTMYSLIPGGACQEAGVLYVSSRSLKKSSTHYIPSTAWHQEELAKRLVFNTCPADRLKNQAHMHTLHTKYSLTPGGACQEAGVLYVSSQSSTNQAHMHTLHTRYSLMLERAGREAANFNVSSRSSTKCTVAPVSAIMGRWAISLEVKGMQMCVCVCVRVCTYCRWLCAPAAGDHSVQSSDH